MTETTPSAHELWARFRFSVVGPLLSAPPPEGELDAALQELTEREWNHPTRAGKRIRFAFSTIERWFYRAKGSPNPIAVLRPGVRKDAGHSRAIREDLESFLRKQHQDHPGWSYQLHHDNLFTLVKKDPKLGPAPSYASVRRFMRGRGLHRTKRTGNEKRPGLVMARARLDKLEVRGYEVEHVGALWHLDFHTSKCIGVVDADGNWVKPTLLAILDDHSRLCCHAQFYFESSTAVLVHGYTQALLKRDLPRALMSDNGGEMTSAEFVQGLEKLSTLHETTLPYSPHQNGKQEHFWDVVEGRLLAMLDNVRDLTLDNLNVYLQAWVEGDYHENVHSETKQKPRDRFMNGASVLRPSPTPDEIRDCFRKRISRRVRRSDVTISIEGKRYELPAAYRHHERVSLVYARWDMSNVHLFDPRTGKALLKVFPQDLHRNASGKRRVLDSSESAPPSEPSGELPPLLKNLVSEYQAKVVAPAYLPFPSSDDPKTK